MHLGAAPLGRVSACESNVALQPSPFFAPCACRLVCPTRPGRRSAAAPPRCRSPVLRGGDPPRTGEPARPAGTLYSDPPEGGGRGGAQR
ncbi:hypothetical protein NDU88_005966 [Pleurodeles waltl]|uniref:Uncharacterized protein n=1 Tax=Pleurodeles waltl TaxID=8319 RepID=A0AAV7SN53_PLEWA|nr:hypothetical protein NDU88_005966 [Pleurodeles waltl]